LALTDIADSFDLSVGVVGSELPGDSDDELFKMLDIVEEGDNVLALEWFLDFGVELGLVGDFGRKNCLGRFLNGSVGRPRRRSGLGDSATSDIVASEPLNIPDVERVVPLR